MNLDLASPLTDLCTQRAMGAVSCAAYPLPKRSINVNLSLCTPDLINEVCNGTMPC